MDVYSISQISELTGFPASTLRFYDKADLVRPDRTSTGYRSYNESQLERLRFVASSKALGLSLEEIASLLELLDGGDCQPVQQQLLDLINKNIGETEAKIVGLDEFAAGLRSATQRMEAITPQGACDESCGCTTRPAALGITQKRADYQPQTPQAAGATCSLPVEQIPERLSAWRQLFASALDRSQVDSGWRVVLPKDTDLQTLAKLVESEQGCCSFFGFTIEVNSVGVALQVTAPADKQSMVELLMGHRRPTDTEHTEHTD